MLFNGLFGNDILDKKLADDLFITVALLNKNSNNSCKISYNHDQGTYIDLMHKS